MCVKLVLGAHSYTSMSTTDTTTGDRREEAKIRLTEREVERLEFHAPSVRDELLIRLGARCGLRVSESVGWERPDGEQVPGVRPRDLREREVDGQLRYFLKVRGKDTRADADGPKPRTTWVPADTWKTARRYINRHGLEPEEPLIHSQKGGSLARQSARRVVKTVAAGLYEDTGEEKYLAVSSHDLRRFWASHLLQTQDVNPRVLMKLGGWERYESIKPYLRDPRPEVIAEEMTAAGWE
jgi:integrase